MPMRIVRVGKMPLRVETLSLPRSCRFQPAGVNLKLMTNGRDCPRPPAPVPSRPTLRDFVTETPAISYSNMELTTSWILRCTSGSSVRAQTTATWQASRAGIPFSMSLPA